MNRKVLTILLGLILGLPLVFAGVFISRIGSAMKESSAFARNAIPTMSQPWDLAAAASLFGPSRSIDDKDLAAIIADAKKKYGNVKSYKLGGASPSSTQRNGQKLMTFSYNAYAVCEKGNAVIGIETIQEQDRWQLRSLNLRPPEPFEAKHY